MEIDNYDSLIGETIMSWYIGTLSRKDLWQKKLSALTSALSTLIYMICLAIRTMTVS